jgi:hypothetical protein
MAANFTKLTLKIAIQLPLVAESCTICSSRSRRPVRKLLDTPSYERSFQRLDYFSRTVAPQNSRLFFAIFLLGGQLKERVYDKDAVPNTDHDAFRRVARNVKKWVDVCIRERSGHFYIYCSFWYCAVLYILCYEDRLRFKMDIMYSSYVSNFM